MDKLYNTIAADENPGAIRALARGYVGRSSFFVHLKDCLETEVPFASQFAAKIQVHRP